MKTYAEPKPRACKATLFEPVPGRNDLPASCVILAATGYCIRALPAVAFSRMRVNFSERWKWLNDSQNVTFF